MDHLVGKQDCLLDLRRISKAFPGVQALDEVNLQLRAGTVHALMGENGAGKSTLMKILMGLISDYEGDIVLRGRKIDHRGVRQSLDLGIAMIHQELSYVPHMTIAENIFLGKEPSTCVWGWTNQKACIRETKALLRTLGVDLDPNALMQDLSVAEQQMVEIAKALSYDAEIIIMDEPTSALSEREVERLFAIIRDLKNRGCATFYISHKLDEIFQIADEVTVLRDGRRIGTCPIDQVGTDELIDMMVGRELKDVFPQSAALPGAEMLAVKGLGRGAVFQDISFTVRAGEILGLAGLMGAGRTEIIRCLFGLDPHDRGQVSVRGREVTIKCPRHAIAQGLGLVSEDRQVTGLIPCLSLRKNLTLSHLHRCARGPFVSRSRENRLADEMIGELSIKTTSREQLVRCLSGGNQQKVVLGKALLGAPDILILDEPTRGIDVGAQAEIYQLMRRLADQGKAIIMVSSDLTEILGMSDRIMVLREGRITRRLDRRGADSETIMKYALGD